MDQKQLLEYDGIVTVSGDGLLHEVVNGLFSREDQVLVQQIKVGILPGGTGNALCAQLCLESNLLNDVYSCAFLILKGKKRLMDLIVFETDKYTKIYSFIGLMWGFLSDVNIESESLRYINSLRYSIQGLRRLLFLRSYTCKLYYSYEIQKIPQIDETLNSKDMNIINGDIISFLIMNIKCLTYRINSSPESEIDDSLFNLQMIHAKNNGRANLIKYLFRLQYGAESISLNEIKQQAMIDYQMLKFFRLEPHDNTGCFSIDGEQYPVGKIQGYVLHKALNVYCF